MSSFRRSSSARALRVEPSSPLARHAATGPLSARHRDGSPTADELSDIRISDSAGLYSGRQRGGDRASIGSGRPRLTSRGGSARFSDADSAVSFEDDGRMSPSTARGSRLAGSRKGSERTVLSTGRRGDAATTVRRGGAAEAPRDAPSATRRARPSTAADKHRKADVELAIRRRSTLSRARPYTAGATRNLVREEEARVAAAAAGPGHIGWTVSQPSALTQRFNSELDETWTLLRRADSRRRGGVLEGRRSGKATQTRPRSAHPSTQAGSRPGGHLLERRFTVEYTDIVSSFERAGYSREHVGTKWTRTVWEPNKDAGAPSHTATATSARAAAGDGRGTAGSPERKPRKQKWIRASLKKREVVGAAARRVAEKVEAMRRDDKKQKALRALLRERRAEGDKIRQRNIADAGADQSERAREWHARHRERLESAWDRAEAHFAARRARIYHNLSDGRQARIYAAKLHGLRQRAWLKWVLAAGRFTMMRQSLETRKLSYVMWYRHHRAGFTVTNAVRRVGRWRRYTGERSALLVLATMFQAAVRRWRRWYRSRCADAILVFVRQMQLQRRIKIVTQLYKRKAMRAYNMWVGFMLVVRARVAGLARHFDRMSKIRTDRLVSSKIQSLMKEGRVAADTRDIRRSIAASFTQVDDSVRDKLLTDWLRERRFTFALSLHDFWKGGSALHARRRTAASNAFPCANSSLHNRVPRVVRDAQATDRGDAHRAAHAPPGQGGHLRV